MEKQLVYKFDYGDGTWVILHELTAITEWIKADMEMLTPEEQEKMEFIIRPTYMTQEELDNLPEL